MNRMPLLAIGTMIFALTAVAQQPTTSAGDSAKSVSSSDHAVVPTPEEQLTFLTGKLDLTDRQRKRIEPALQELHDATEKLVQDETLSRDERLSKVRECRQNADKKIRALLNDDQKKKLDQVEHEPHPELHGNVSGARATPSQH